MVFIALQGSRSRSQQFRHSLHQERQGTSLLFDIDVTLTTNFAAPELVSFSWLPRLHVYLQGLIQNAILGSDFRDS